MLELRDIQFSISKDGEDVHLLEQVHLKVPAGHFMAIVGPSGCGKSTLLKLIAGINVESKGHVIWNGRDLSTEGDLEPAEIGYVPQFSIAYEQLTVEESIESAVRL
ncbi:MAG: ATP-binding cassette domain-containing protein, partial [Verrucomicrobiae bacterium]|nr:ATP-binding cassette domain-containing protein [Verrucomicrobiae bacterium]